MHSLVGCLPRPQATPPAPGCLDRASIERLRERYGIAKPLRSPPSILPPPAPLPLPILLLSEVSEDVPTRSCMDNRVAHVELPSAVSPSTSSGRTFFAGLLKKFANVRRVQSSWCRPSDGTLELEPHSFIAACRELATIYDRMGSFLSPAKKDMMNNLATIEAGIAARNAAYSGGDGGSQRAVKIATLLDAARYDIEHKLCFRETRDRRGVSFGILWLIRALRFIDILLTNLLDCKMGQPEARQCAADAYHRSIRPYHGRLLSMTFGVMVGQVPSRRKLILELAKPMVAPAARAASSQPPASSQPRAIADASAPTALTPPGKLPTHRRAASRDGIGNLSTLRCGPGPTGAPATPPRVYCAVPQPCQQPGDLKTKPAKIALPPTSEADAIATEAEVYGEMAAFLKVYSPMVQELYAWFVSHGLDDAWKA